MTRIESGGVPGSRNASTLAGVRLSDLVARLFGMDRAAPNAMRAVVVKRFGPPEVMRVHHIDCRNHLCPA